jgi:chromosomal replication initiator protein
VVKNPGSKVYNPLFIYGNSGLGKTHLLCAIGTAIHENTPDAKIAYVKGEEFTNKMVRSIKEGTADEFRQKYRGVDLFLVDDIQFIAGKEATQEEFFHTFNSIYEAGHQIVITSDRPPIDMLRLDDRLRTRFEGGLMADVQPPDVETRMAIIRNKAGHLGMQLSDDIVSYIAQKITSNVRQIEGVINRLTAFRELTGDVVTREKVDDAVKVVIRDGVYVPTPDVILEETARFYQVSAEDIKGISRQKNIVTARHITAYLIRNLTNQTLPMIGTFLNRDHATVLASIRKIEGQIKSDKDLSATIRDITSNINSRQ